MALLFVSIESSVKFFTALLGVNMLVTCLRRREVFVPEDILSEAAVLPVEFLAEAAARTGGLGLERVRGERP